MYQSLTGYFNTYYNASRLYKSAVQEVENGRGAEIDTNYFAIPEGAKSNEKFDKVIEKCSKVIQFYPRSEWVDNAVLLIGKSYVYKGQYESAIREFSDLLNNFPTSGFRFETRLWSAKAEYYTRRPDESLKQLKDLIPDAHQDGQNDVELEALALESQIYFERGEYGQTIEILMQASGVSGDDDLRAHTQLQLGICYERLGQFPKAAGAYGAVGQYGADFPREVRARLKQAEMYNAAGGQQKALDVLNELKAEALKSDQRGQVELGIADVYNGMGDTARSFTMYNRIDTAYPHTDAAVKSYYQRGLVCEHDRHDFRAALFFYGKASKENAASEVTAMAQRKFESFSNYFVRCQTLHQYDSLLVIALQSDSGFSAADSFGIEDGMLVSNDDSLVVAPPRGRGREPHGDRTVAQDNPQRLNVAPPQAPNERMQPPQEGERAGAGERSRGGQQPTGQADRSNSTAGNRASVDEFTLPTVAVSVPAKFPPDSLRSRMAQTDLGIASSFYLDFHLSDSALAWYRRVVSDAPRSGYVPEALYAMADVYNGLHDTIATDSLYRRIVYGYPSSEYALQASKNLGLQAVVERDSTQEIAFQNAEVLLQGGQVESALRDLRAVARHLDTTDVLTSKVFYTIGWIFENVLMKNDSAAAWYELLIKQFPTSIYAGDVKAKVGVREDPKSLSEYVKVKETETPDKTKNPSKKESTVPTSEAKDTDEDTDQQDEQVNQGRRQSTDDDSDEDQQDDNDNQPSDDNGGQN